MEGTRGPGHDSVIGTPKPRIPFDQVLSAPFENRDPFQGELSHHRGQKGDAAAAGFHQRERDLGLDDFQWETWNSSSGAEIEHPCPPRRHPPEEKERVEEELFGDVGRPPVTRQVLHAIPLEQQPEVAGEGLRLGRGRGTLENLVEPVGENLREARSLALRGAL